MGYRRPRTRVGTVSDLAPNRLQRQFDVDRPNEVRVNDITHIRTHEGRLYLAMVIDLYSRRLVGWSMHLRIRRDLVLNALLMAVWRIMPTRTFMVHSDQVSQ